MKANYSDKEFAMIKALSPQWAKIIEDGHDGSVAGKAIRECKPYRMTPEYDALIQL